MFFLLGMLDRFKHYNNHLMIQNSIESQHIFKHHNNLINFYYSITQASQHIESHLQNVGQASQHRGASSSSSTASRSSWTSRPAASAPWCRSPTSKTQPPMLGKHRAVTHQALALFAFAQEKTWAGGVFTKIPQRGWGAQGGFIAYLRWR
jgi:hypothetical protein